MFQPRCHRSPEDDFKRLCDSAAPRICICTQFASLASERAPGYLSLVLCPWEERSQGDKVGFGVETTFSVLRFTICCYAPRYPASAARVSGVIPPLKQKVQPSYFLHGVKKYCFFFFRQQNSWQWRRTDLTAAAAVFFLACYTAASCFSHKC